MTAEIIEIRHGWLLCNKEGTFVKTPSNLENMPLAVGQGCPETSCPMIENSSQQPGNR